MQKTDIGIIGLAVMGRSLALNMADHGFKVGGYNRSKEVTDTVMREHPHKNLIPFYTLEELVESQEHPRKFMMMVKAGNPVDAVIAQLEPLLDEGEILSLKIPEGAQRRLHKKGFITLAWEFPAEKKERGSALPLCRVEMNRPIRLWHLYWRRSQQRHRESRAVHTWDLTGRDIM